MVYVLIEVTLPLARQLQAILQLDGIADLLQSIFADILELFWAYLGSKVEFGLDVNFHLAAEFAKLAFTDGVADDETLLQLVSRSILRRFLEEEGDTLKFELYAAKNMMQAIVEGATRSQILSLSWLVDTRLDQTPPIEKCFAEAQLINHMLSSDDSSRLVQVSHEAHAKLHVAKWKLKVFDTVIEAKHVVEMARCLVDNDVGQGGSRGFEAFMIADIKAREIVERRV